MKFSGFGSIHSQYFIGAHNVFFFFGWLRAVCLQQCSGARSARIVHAHNVGFVVLQYLMFTEDSVAAVSSGYSPVQRCTSPCHLLLKKKKIQRISVTVEIPVSRTDRFLSWMSSHAPAVCHSTAGAELHLPGRVTCGSGRVQVSVKQVWGFPLLRQVPKKPAATGRGAMTLTFTF